MTREKLFAAAKKMLEHSYAPYSNFKVGAAIECADGTIFSGCNIENASFSATICAERVAITKAISEGYKDFIRIVITSESEQFCPPCGSCLQVISEFVDDDFEIIMLNSAGEYKTTTLGELLPYRFNKTIM